MSFEGRQLSNPRDLRALSHPLRLRLLELLDGGPMTATEAANVLHTTPANCSFHLRLLAKHGFVSEVPGGRGRQRPWQLVEQDVNIDGRTLDAEGRLAAQALTAVMDERHRQRVADWRRFKHGYPSDWQAAAAETFTSAYLTPAELAEATDAFRRALRPYQDRDRADRPPGAMPVDISLSAIPRQRPKERP